MPSLARTAARVGALAAIAAVLLQPLWTDAQESFAAHMLQHLLLIAAAAPLLAVSGMFDSFFRTPTGRFIAKPEIAWSLFVAVFLFWHWPKAFQWAAHHEATTILELATILAAASVFWIVTLSEINPGRLSAGARALLVMTAAIATDLPGVVMVFAPRAICTMPGENAAAFGLTPLEDQQIAGLLMWVPANLAFFSIATWLFARWMAETSTETFTRNGP